MRKQTYDLTAECGLRRHTNVSGGLCTQQRRFQGSAEERRSEEAVSMWPLLAAPAPPKQLAIAIPKPLWRDISMFHIAQDSCREQNMIIPMEDKLMVKRNNYKMLKNTVVKS